jgi:hypothetical protein
MTRDILYHLLMTIHDLHIFTSFLINVKALDAFKTYKMKVERQLEKKIKIVRSDRGGEYYMVYTQGQGKDRVHLQIFLKNKAFSLGIQC